MSTWRIEDKNGRWDSVDLTLQGWVVKGEIVTTGQVGLTRVGLMGWIEGKLRVPN